MARNLKSFDITNRPGLREIIQELRETNAPLLLRQDSEDVAIIQPVRQSVRPSRQRRKTSAHDAIWDIVGMADSAGPGDVADNVDTYLADAIVPREH